MHQEPEHEDYDDDEYKYYPQYNEYGYPYNSKKFDIDWTAWEQWLSKALKEIVEENHNTWSFGYAKNNKSEKFSVSDGLSKGTLSDKYFMYLGSNHYDESVWKTKYFVCSKIEKAYKNHISSNAAHFLKQPSYYKGMFENLN